MNMEYETKEETVQTDITIERPFELEPDFQHQFQENLQGPIQAQAYLEKPSFNYQYAYDYLKQNPHADVIYFFPEGSKTGVKVYLQCPKEALEEGKLIVSGMELVEYDENIHGVKDEWHLRKVKDGESFGELTREVSEEDYAKIVLQGVIQTHPETPGKQHYFVIDLQETNTKAVERLTQIMDTPADNLQNPEVCAHLLDDHLGALVRIVNNKNLNQVVQQYPNFEDKRLYETQVDLNINMYNDTFDKDVFIKEQINGDEPKGPKV